MGNLWGNPRFFSGPKNRQKMPRRRKEEEVVMNENWSYHPCSLEASDNECCLGTGECVEEIERGANRALGPGIINYLFSSLNDRTNGRDAYCELC